MSGRTARVTEEAPTAGVAPGRRLKSERTGYIIMITHPSRPGGNGQSSFAAQIAAYLPANAVATDSEWDYHLKDMRYGPWLSTTFVSPGGAVEVYVRDDLPSDICQRLRDEARRRGVTLYPFPRFDDAPLLWGSLPDLVEGYNRGLGGETARTTTRRRRRSRSCSTSPPRTLNTRWAGTPGGRP